MGDKKLEKLTTEMLLEQSNTNLQNSLRSN